MHNWKACTLGVCSINDFTSFNFWMSKFRTRDDKWSCVVPNWSPWPLLHVPKISLFGLVCVKSKVDLGMESVPSTIIRPSTFKCQRFRTRDDKWSCVVPNWSPWPLLHVSKISLFGLVCVKSKVDLGMESVPSTISRPSTFKCQRFRTRDYKWSCVVPIWSPWSLLNAPYISCWCNA
jgi:hypothetical protein